MCCRGGGDKVPMKPIKRGTGVTDSERYLARVAEKTFLNLWSYPNTFIEKKLRGQGDGKELCDLLVVFGDDVLVFSDKEIEFQPHSDIFIAWNRWYRAAVQKSVAQIHGAERFLRDHQEKIFLDKGCTEPFPITLPNPEEMRFHGVSVAIGAEDAARRYWGGDDGTLIIADTSTLGEPGIGLPFSVGDPNPGKSFVHVFDRTSLDALFTEFDTVADLVEYLSHRAAVIRDGSIVAAHSEKDMIATYLQNEDEQGNHSFGLPMRAPNQVLSIAEGLYEIFQKRPEYKAGKEADAVSYTWDKLITQFTGHVLAGSSVKITHDNPSAALAEPALRFMAAEPRVRRRVLSQAFLEALSKSAELNQDRYARVVLPGDDVSSKVAYIFLILKYPSFLDDKGGYDQYRRARVTILETYGYAILQDHRSIETVVGIAIDGHDPSTEYKGGSEDLMALQVGNWNEELEAEITQRRSELEILNSGQMRYNSVSAQQFPSPQTFPAKETRQQRRARERREAKEKRLSDS